MSFSASWTYLLRLQNIVLPFFIQPFRVCEEKSHLFVVAIYFYFVKTIELITQCVNKKYILF